MQKKAAIDCSYDKTKNIHADNGFLAMAIKPEILFTYGILSKQILPQLKMASGRLFMQVPLRQHPSIS